MKKFFSLFALVSIFAVKSNATIGVVLGGLNPPTQVFTAGAQDASIAVFILSRQGNDSVVTSLTFSRIGIAFDDVANLKIYRNGVLLGTASFSGGQAVFNGLHIGLSTSSAVIDVRADINANTNSTSFGGSLTKLTSIITPNQIVNLSANIHFLSTASVVFNNNVFPNGWQFSPTGNFSPLIWGTGFSVSTTTVMFDTIKLTVSGTVPAGVISNPELWIDNNQYIGTITGNKITFILDNGSGSALQFLPGIYSVNIYGFIAPCTVGILTLSIDGQSGIKYHTALNTSQQYTPSGTYPLRSYMELTPCFTYFATEQNIGTNAYSARFILQNVQYSPGDPTPLAILYLRDQNNNSSTFIDSTRLSWNGFAYEGVAHYSALEADRPYYWQVETVVNGNNYPQWMATNQSSFYFSTKVCYEANAGITKVDTITSKSATITAKLQYPHPANGTEWYSSFYLLNEDKKDAYPTTDTSVVFGTMWQTPQRITDTVKGTYVAKNLDSCTNYSYWLEFRQPCGGVIKSEVGHFRTKGNCHTEDNKLFIFPNPANDYIIVRFNYGRDSAQQIGIYDLNGRMVQIEKVINSQQRIDISRLPAGMYIVNALRNGVRYPDLISGKFIKQK